MIQDPNAPLLAELRWFVGQRWRAGCIVIFGAILGSFQVRWIPQEIGILTVGIAILLYNAVFATLMRKSTQWLDVPKNQRTLAWIQIVLDLTALTFLVVLTNGIFSPLLGLFVLHMIFASLLLHPPKHTAYIACSIAMAMLGVALAITNQLPSTQLAGFIAAGWAGTLLMTVYFTTHITSNLCANHARTRAVLDAAADAVITFNQDGQVEHANPAAHAMFGITSSQIIAQPITKFLSIADLQGCSLPSSCTTLNVSQGFALKVDGTLFPVEASISKFTLNHHPVHTVIVRDITDRINSEAELKSLNAELTKHQDQLVQHEKMIAVGRMAAGVAHEIANPLANIDGLIQLVERNPERMSTTTPAQLREQVSRITNIVHQLKDFAHPAEAQKKTISVDQLISSALEMIRFDTRYRQVIYEPNPLCSKLHISIHPQSIQQVLVNLIVNALDAAVEDQKHIVTINAQCIDKAICQISITDTGTGIPESHIGRIFEPFFTTKPIGQGTGLGLSISYNLVQREGGKITVQSSTSDGTTVCVQLPLCQNEQNQ